MRTLIGVFCLVFVSLSSAFAQTSEQREARQQASLRFQDIHYQEGGVMRWNDKTDTPAMIRGYQVQGYDGEPQAAAKAFFKSEKEMFGFKDVDAELRLKDISESFGSSRVTFEQLSNGIPIIGSGYIVAFNKDGAIFYLSGDYYPDVRVRHNPSLTRGNAIQIAYSAIEEDVEVTKGPEVKIFVNKESEDLVFHLVYDIRIEQTAERGAGWDLLVDAHSGDIVKMTELGFPLIDPAVYNSLEEEPHHDPVAPLIINQGMQATGSGYVYNTHPDHYSNTVQMPLNRLYTSSPWKLNGTHVKVLNMEGAEATSSDGVFNYASTNTHFDEVMVYRHGDTFKDWLKTKGLPSNVLLKVTVETHHPTEFARSFGSINTVRFGDETSWSSAFHNPTHEAAVIAHEFTHQAIYDIGVFDVDIDDVAEFHEGYADYFGIAYRKEIGGENTTVLMEYIDKPGAPFYERNVNNNYLLSQMGQNLDGSPSHSEHDDGMIIAGVLWDIRTDPNVNNHKADKLILASVGFYDSSPVFEEAKDVVIAAANSLGYSYYVDDIEDAFVAHGWPDPVQPPTNLVISNAGQNNQYVQLAWNHSATSGATYWVDRCNTGNPAGSLPCNWSTIKSNHSGNSYTDNFVTISSSGDTFKYRVRAKKNGEFSVPSNLVSTKGSSPFSIGSKADDATPLMESPTEFGLKQNYPNPFNPETEIIFSLAEQSHTKLTVHDMLGRVVAVLVDGVKEVGSYSVSFKGDNLPSGTYIYKLETPYYTDTRVMMLLK